MNERARVSQAEFDRMTKEEQIQTLCAYYECKPKIAAIHFDQFVYRHWNPHPPRGFVNWWMQHPDFVNHHVPAPKAFNCQCYRDQYSEHKARLAPQPRW